MQKILDYISSKTFRNVFCFILFTSLMTAAISSQNFFFQTIIEEDPDLLIIDTHGDVDINTHESFLFVCDEKITGDDVVRSRIKPRLVFLSACNTFTTYNTVATIANSFAIHGIKVIDSSKGLFVQMPQSSYKQKDGQVQYNDIFHAITADARAELIDSVKNAYEERLHMEEEQSQGEEIEDGLTQTM